MSFCVTCKNKKEQIEQDFVVLPGSSDKPILGIQAMRDMDLVGKNPELFRTAEALAQQPSPIASAGDKVTTLKPGSDKSEGEKNPSNKRKSQKALRKKKKLRDGGKASNPLRDKKAGPQGKLGTLDAMKSRRILP